VLGLPASGGPDLHGATALPPIHRPRLGAPDLPTDRPRLRQAA
jgi:hypothetical protein